MSAIVTAGLRLPYRLYDDGTVLTETAEITEHAVELAIYLWCDYQDGLLLDIPRLLLRPDLTRDQFAALAVELCERSIDVDDAVRGRVAIAYADDYARHLAKMATRPAVQA